MNPIPREQHPDPEMTAIIDRFEHAYAELTGRDPPSAPSTVAPLFPEDDYRLPGENVAPNPYDNVDKAEHNRTLRPRTEPRAAEVTDARANPSPAVPLPQRDDIESSLALLRAGERTQRPDAEASPGEPLHVPAPVVSSGKMRRWALPGAAIAVFVALLGGYAITRHGAPPADSAALPESPRSFPDAPLRMDYEIAKFRRGEAVAHSKNR